MGTSWPQGQSKATVHKIECTSIYRFAGQWSNPDNPENKTKQKPLSGDFSQQQHNREK